MLIRPADLPMKSSLRVLNFGFLPRSADLALCFLRVALGLSMLLLHGWGKLIHLKSGAGFPDPLGIGRYPTLLLALFAEIFCSALLIGGILTRFAAAVLLVTMGTAFFLVHGGDFLQPGAELAALYGFGFATLIISGGGRFSADGATGPYSLAAMAGVAGALAGYPLSYFFQGGAYQAAVPLPNYLTSLREVLTNDATLTTALVVWISTFLVLALVGFLVGRAMHRRAGTTAAMREAPPAAP
jgi:putative oxidoreductase